MAIRFHESGASAEIKSKNLLKKWLKDLIISENCSLGQINIIFTTDSTLLALNKKYLSRDYLTDIITFDYSDNQNIEGDLYISVQRVKENAEKFKVNFTNELKRVIVHGILHMLGYDDKSERKKSLIRQKEDHYLKSSPAI